MITFKPLLKLLIDRNIGKTELRLKAGFSMATLAKISNDQYIAMSIVNDICRVLDCRIEDIMEYVPDPDASEDNEQPIISEKKKS